MPCLGTLLCATSLYSINIQSADESSAHHGHFQMQHSRQPHVYFLKLSCHCLQSSYSWGFGQTLDLKPCGFLFWCVCQWQYFPTHVIDEHGGAVRGSLASSLRPNAVHQLLWQCQIWTLIGKSNLLLHFSFPSCNDCLGELGLCSVQNKCDGHNTSIVSNSSLTLFISRPQRVAADGISLFISKLLLCSYLLRVNKPHLTQFYWKPYLSW